MERDEGERGREREGERDRERRRGRKREIEGGKERGWRGMKHFDGDKFNSKGGIVRKSMGRQRETIRGRLWRGIKT